MYQALYNECMRQRLFHFIEKNHLPLILGLAMVLRLPLLNGSFWLDEAAQYLESIRPLSEQLNIAYDFQPPLFHLIIHFWLYLGKSEWWVRLIPLMCGIVTIWATYQLGKKLANWKVGALAALFLTTNSFHIYFSQELRPYSLATMFGLLSWLVLMHWKSETPKSQINIQQQFRLASGHFVLFAVLTALGLYSTYLYPFLVLSQLVYIFLLKKSLFTSVVTATGFASLTFLPWLPKFYQQLQVGGQLRQTTLGWDQVVSIPQLKALPLTIGKFIYGVVDLDVNLFFLTSTLALLFGFGFLLRKVSSAKTAYLPFQSLIGFGFPILTAWLVSFVIPVLQPKRVLFCLPFLYLGLSWLIFQAKHTQPKRVAGLLGAILLLINLSGTFHYINNPRYQRENWRELITTINRSYSPVNTTVVFGFDEPFAPWLVYNQVHFQTFTTGTATVTTLDQIREELNPALDFDTIIVFDYLRDLTDPSRFTEQWLTQYNYQQAELYEYPGVGFVRVFRRTKIIGSYK